MHSVHPSSPPIRLVIVGCGAITEDFHLPAALRSNKVEVTALVDSRTERATQMLRKYGFQTKISGQLEDVLDLADGILVATPNHAHASVAMVALATGKPVLIEKPLTTTYADAVRLCNFAQEKHTFISVGFRTRHQPNVRLIKRLVDDGFFGPVRRVHAEFGTRGGWTSVSSYNLDRKTAGGGVLVGSGCYFLDLFLYWFGEPEIIGYEDDSYGGPEANCKARLRFLSPDGAFEATLFCSKTTALQNAYSFETEFYDCSCKMSATEDVIVRPKDRPWMEMRLGLPQSMPPPDYFQVQLEEFADCIRSGKPPLVDGWSAAQSVKLTEELYACRTQAREPWMWYAGQEVASART
jgi:predicted dehydrogenase